MVSSRFIIWFSVAHTLVIMEEEQNINLKESIGIETAKGHKIQIATATETLESLTAYAIQIINYLEEINGETKEKNYVG